MTRISDTMTSAALKQHEDGVSALAHADGAVRDGKNLHTFTEGTQEYARVKEARRRLHEILEQKAALLRDPETGQRVSVDTSNLFLDADTGAACVPVRLLGPDGSVVRDAGDLTVDETEKFIMHFLQRIRGGKVVMSRAQNDNQHNQQNMSIGEMPQETQNAEPEQPEAQNGSTQSMRGTVAEAKEQTPEELRRERKSGIIKELEKQWEAKHGPMERSLSGAEIRKAKERAKAWGEEWDGRTTKMTEQASEFFFDHGGNGKYSVPNEAERILVKQYPEYTENAKRKQKQSSAGQIQQSRTSSEAQRPTQIIEDKALENIQEEVQEMRSEKRHKAYEAERAVFDIAQEIGVLREEIAQTDGDLTDHKEKIAELIEKLTVARESFGNYGEETNLLALKLDKLKEKMQHLQESAQGTSADAGTGKENSFAVALEKARKDNVASFVVGDNVYMRIGEHYILDSQGGANDAKDGGDSAPTSEALQEDAKQNVEHPAEESVSTLAALEEDLQAKRAQVVALADASEEERSAATQAYTAARAAYIAQHPDGDDPQIRAELLARERRALAHHVREHAGDGDPLDDKGVRAAEKFLADTKKERAQMDNILGKGRLNALVPEQFINPDGSQMSPEEIKDLLNNQLDAMQSTLDARLHQENVAPSAAKRIGRKLLVITGIAGTAKAVRDMYVSRPEILEARQAHEEWEKRTLDERRKKAGKSPDVSYWMGGKRKGKKEKEKKEVPTAELNTENVSLEKECEAQKTMVTDTQQMQEVRPVQEETPSDNELLNNNELPSIEELNKAVKEEYAMQEDVSVPELTERVDVKAQAAQRIARVLKEFKISSGTFREKMQDLPLKDFSTNMNINNTAQQFMLLYMDGAVEDFGDKVNVAKNTKLAKMSFGGYMLLVEEMRVKQELAQE